MSSLTLSAVAEKWTFERELMGTRFTIVCYTEDQAAAQKAAEAAFSIGDKVNAVASDYQQASDPIATAACVLGQNGLEMLKKIPGVREVKIRTLQESRHSTFPESRK